MTRLKIEVDLILDSHTNSKEINGLRDIADVMELVKYLQVN